MGPGNALSLQIFVFLFLSGHDGRRWGRREKRNRGAATLANINERRTAMQCMRLFYGKLRAPTRQTTQTIVARDCNS